MFSIAHVISQGSIFQSFNYVRWVTREADNLVIDEIEIPFLVVLTQSCDLEWHFKDEIKQPTEKRDKYIQSILVCPAYIAQSVKEGKHLEKLGLIMESYNTDRWTVIKKNNNPRYHFLEVDSKLGLPELVLDFKQYYTIPTHVLKNHKAQCIGQLYTLYRENLSHRFAFYLSRIGLPNMTMEQ